MEEIEDIKGKVIIVKTKRGRPRKYFNVETKEKKKVGRPTNYEWVNGKVYCELCDIWVTTPSRHFFCNSHNNNIFTKNM